MALTAEQRDIIKSIGKRPLLVLAGPGTGKTEILSCAVLYLLRNGLANKREITAIAFTTKAAGGMRDRLKALGLAREKQPLVCTLHSLSMRILRERGVEIGVPNEFMIADEYESKLLFRDAIMDADSRALINLKALHHKMSLLKAKRKGPEDIPKGLLKHVYLRYQKLLRFHSALDFQDLIVEVCKVLETSEEVRSAYQHKAEYLLVDEFQDINRAEYRFIQLLAGHPDGLLVVGDDSQSIYSWRGGDPEIILSFCRDFPGATEKPMTICFRCPEKIIKGADEFIKRKFPLIAQQHNPEPIRILDCKSDVQESRCICEWIETAVRNGDYRPRDIAILFRGGDIADKVADGLTQASIPIVRPSPEETAHVREFIACLRLIANRKDSLALRVCLASPLAAGIGDKGLKKLRRYAEINGCSFWEALAAACSDDSFKIWHKPLKAFASMLDEMSKIASAKKLSELLRAVATRLGYEKEARIEKMIRNSQLIPDNQNLGDYIQEIRGLRGEKAADPRESAEDVDDAVLFITTHSVKGLERKVIFVIGMEEGRFPQANAHIDEQRRLFYVAMTRAKEKLFLCSARKREGRSAQGLSFCDRSCFISEIPRCYRQLVQTGN